MSGAGLVGEASCATRSDACFRGMVDRAKILPNEYVGQIDEDGVGSKGLNVNA